MHVMRAPARVPAFACALVVSAVAPPGRADEGALERRNVGRRGARLIATALTLFGVGIVAAVVGDVLARLLVLSSR